MGFFQYIKEEIQVIKERDPAIKSSAEVLLYPTFWVMLSYRRAHKLYLKGHYFWARYISQRAARKTGIEIHPGATIGKGFFIDHGSGVIIGETAIVGDNVTLYQGVTLGGTGKETGKRHPTLGDNVMVSAGAKIIGVVPRFLEEKTDNYPYLDEIIRTEELSDRKDKMIALSDMFIAVPGGIGTLDELFSILAMKASDRLRGEIAIYNVNGFFDGLLDCLKQMERGGFLYSRLEDLFRVETPESLGL